MGPRIQKKPKKKRFSCYEVEGERFHAQVDDVFRYNWWEVFCFPYILCSRVWECCIALCAGTNQCMIYWMIIQWIVCKITRMTTPDPIIFPYYFYMFCQVILLTAFFIWLWVLFGKSVLIPYLMAFVDALKPKPYEFPGDKKSAAENASASRLRFRKYCFRKGEIFDVPPEQHNLGAMYESNYVLSLLTIAVDIFVYEMFV